MCEGINWKKQRAETRYGIMRMLAWCEKILNDKKTSLSRQTAMFEFFTSSAATRASKLVLLDTGDEVIVGLPAVQEKLSLPLILICHFIFSVNFS